MKLIRRHFKVIDSTNNWAKQQAHLLPREAMTLVTADEQTAGRGRFKRLWQSPPGANILASFCFFMKTHRRDIGNISQIMAISAVQTLNTLTFQATLKWPNDILLSKKKVAGILVETTPVADHLCVIVGIGLNVNMSLEQLQHIDRPATSLSIEAGQTFDTEAILESIYKRFTANLNYFLEKGFDPFLEEYTHLISSSHEIPVCFTDQGAVWEGTFESINRDGSYNLKLLDGTLKTFYSGELQIP